MWALFRVSPSIRGGRTEGAIGGALIGGGLSLESEETQSEGRNGGEKQRSASDLPLGSRGGVLGRHDEPYGDSATRAWQTVKIHDSSLYLSGIRFLVVVFHLS